MFLDYKDIYPNAYKVLEFQLKKNRISHAYLFEINDDQDYKFINSFIKEFIFASNKTNVNKIRKQIDNQTFDSLKIVETDLKIIKKEQILDLKSELKTISVTNDYSVYLIKDAHKLNDSSGNTLLKFLEEPEENIIGILTTNNIYSILPTILSRCQIISLKENTNKKTYNFEKSIDKVLELLYSIDNNKFNSIALIPNYFKNIEFDEINDFLNTALFLLLDLLNLSLGRELIYFNLYEEKIRKLNDKDINSISNKINVVLDLIENNYTNINKSMLFDKMIIELSGGITDVKC